MTLGEGDIMRIWIVLLGLAFSVWALAEDAPIGYVKTTTGEAYVTSGGIKTQAKAGTPVFVGSQLKTGVQSSLGVTFKDETVMSFGPDTELTVDEYLYAPSQGKLKLGSKLAKGSLNYISGVIAKLQPDAVTVTTPTGTIGVRGTHFAIKIEAE
jgi:hypothetical protein